jgi:hypothetical protein
MFLTAGPAHAAGGHHDVDDAVILEPGHCQVELWAMRWTAPRLRAAHAGPACRLGAVEWSLNLDRVRNGDNGTSSDLVGPAWKVAAELVPRRLAVGAAAGVAWRTAGGRRPVKTAFVPVTAWLVEGQVQLHFNAGVDDDAATGRFGRLGVGVDWAPDPRWTLTLEHRRQFGASAARAGLRFNITPLISLDISHADGKRQRVAVLGLTVEWGR